MITIAINTAGSYQNLPELKNLCRKHNWTLKEITMEYNPSNGLPLKADIEHWPFRALFEEDGNIYEVRIFTLTVGYGGSGPTDFASILDYFNVPYEEEDIYTNKRVDSDGFIRLKYIK